MSIAAMTGLEAHELETWLPDGRLPEWVSALREKHLSAVGEYQSAIAGAVDVSAQTEADARAWRRAVRAAVAQGKEPPVREFSDEVASATREVAQEDCDFARRELAVVASEILAVIRQRREDFMPYYMDASPELRMALGRGPDGLDEKERMRRAALRSEPSMVDLSDPANHRFAELGDQEVTNAAA